MSWGHLGRGELHHAQQEHNCSWLLSLGGLIWEAPDVCRSSIPRDTPSGYLEGAGEASSDHSSSTDAVLGSITCLPHGLGHFISVSLSLPSLSVLSWQGDHPPTTHCMDSTTTPFPKLKKLFWPCHIPGWDRAFPRSWCLLEPAGGIHHYELALLNFAFHFFDRRNRQASFQLTFHPPRPDIHSAVLFNTT